MQPTKIYVTEICARAAITSTLPTEIIASRHIRREILCMRSTLEALVTLLYEDLKMAKRPDFMIVGGDEWYRLAHELGLLGKEPGREITLRIPEGVFRCIRVKRECLELGYLK